MKRLARCLLASCAAVVWLACAGAGATAVGGSSASAAKSPHQRFELATFNRTPEFNDDHFTDAMFARLNVRRPLGGYFLCTGSDEPRTRISRSGNALAAYYNALTKLYTDSNHDAAAAADAINAHVRKLYGATGKPPKWLVLNEISGSLWPSNDAYRQWLLDAVARLHERHGYAVVVYAPFPKPQANDESWHGLAHHAYVAAERYLSGADVKSHDFSIEWAESQYQATKDAYVARGVPAEKLFLGEHFGQTPAGTNWGRSGVTADEWERAIRVRDEAILNCDFAGFLSYAWGKNGMKVSDAELTRFIEAHMRTPVLQTEVANRNPKRKAATESRPR